MHAELDLIEGKDVERPGRLVGQDAGHRFDDQVAPGADGRSADFPGVGQDLTSKGQVRKHETGDASIANIPGRSSRAACPGKARGVALQFVSRVSRREYQMQRALPWACTLAQPSRLEAEFLARRRPPRRREQARHSERESSVREAVIPLKSAARTVILRIVRGCKQAAHTTARLRPRVPSP